MRSAYFFALHCRSASSYSLYKALQVDCWAHFSDAMTRSTMPGNELSAMVIDWIFARKYYLSLSSCMHGLWCSGNGQPLVVIIITIVSTFCLFTCSWCLVLSSMAWCTRQAKGSKWHGGQVRTRRSGIMGHMYHISKFKFMMRERELTMYQCEYMSGCVRESSINRLHMVESERREERKKYGAKARRMAWEMLWMCWPYVGTCTAMKTARK